MKSLQDALYNWLSIKVVCDARPEDKAATNTLQLFDKILKEEHQVDEIIGYESDESMYMIFYKRAREEKSMRFPVEMINSMLDAIEKEPEKYPVYKDEI